MGVYKVHIRCIWVYINVYQVYTRCIWVVYKMYITCIWVYISRASSVPIFPRFLNFLYISLFSL